MGVFDQRLGDLEDWPPVRVSGREPFQASRQVGWPGEAVQRAVRRGVNGDEAGGRQQFERLDDPAFAVSGGAGEG